MIKYPLRLDGKSVADKICIDLTARVSAMHSSGIIPKLIIVTASEDLASKIYVRNKIKRCEEIGICCEHIVVPSLTEETMEYISNQDCPTIVQMPFVSKTLSADNLGSYISPENDVDGFINLENIAALASGKEPKNYPCTPLGIIRLLDEYCCELNGKSVVIIGRSNIVGRPLARLFEHRGSTVTVCHSKTGIGQKYQAIDRADIVVSATGCIGTISKDEMEDYCSGNIVSLNSASLGWNKTFVDVGINRSNDGKICGDIDQYIKDHCAAYTPVPGGIGPMTVAMLMQNVVEAYERRG